MTDEPAIKTDGVTKTFGRTVALRDLDLVVERGEVYCYVGPNGAGKTTTIDLLVDYERPTSGSIELLGIDPRQDPVAVGERVGVVPEAFGLFDRLTGQEHVEFAIQSNQATDDPDELLDKLGLGEVADDRVTTYSNGMQKRLVVAMAMVGNPEVLVLDEPFSGLDPDGRRLVEELVRAERERGTTVFLSSHNLTEVESVADRVGLLLDGTLRIDGTLAELRREADVPGDAPLSDVYARLTT